MTYILLKINMGLLHLFQSSWHDKCLPCLNPPDAGVGFYDSQGSFGYCAGKISHKI